jgi:hypothetical protein
LSVRNTEASARGSSAWSVGPVEVVDVVEVTGCVVT